LIFLFAFARIPCSLLQGASLDESTLLLRPGAMEHGSAGKVCVPAIIDSDVSAGFKERDNFFQEREPFHFGLVHDRIGIENFVDAQCG
jgi:hypothetical protein